MPLSLAPMSFVFAWVLCAVIPAQRVALPDGTGNIAPDAAWTVLRGTQLERDDRAGDPIDETARGQLHAAVARLRTVGVTDEHVLLHSNDGSGRLRLVDAYSDATRATSEQLASEDARRRMREVLQAELAREADAVEFVAAENLPIGGAAAATRLEFTLQKDGHERTLHHVVMPAGDRLQYFDASHARDDAGGREACLAVVQSFDGLREPGVDPATMLLVVLLGAVLGTVLGMLRRRRQARKLLAAGTGSGGAAG